MPGGPAAQEGRRVDVGEDGCADVEDDAYGDVEGDAYGDVEGDEGRDMGSPPAVWDRLAVPR